MDKCPRTFVANCINTKGIEEKKQQPIPSAPMIQEDKNQDLYEYIPYNISIFPNHEKGQDALQTVKVLNWRLSGFYELIAHIENSIYMLEYDKVPPANTNKFSEKSMSDLDELVQKGVIFNFFESNINCIYGNIEKMKIEIAMLGSKFGAKVVKNKDFKKESVANSFETIQKCFQDIYEKLLALEHDIDELFELL